MRAPCAHVFPETLPDKSSSLQPCGRGPRYEIKSKSKIWDSLWTGIRPKRFALFGGVPVAPGMTSAQHELPIAST